MRVYASTTPAFALSKIPMAVVRDSAAWTSWSRTAHICSPLLSVVGIVSLMMLFTSVVFAFAWLSENWRASVIARSPFDWAQGRLRRRSNPTKSLRASKGRSNLRDGHGFASPCPCGSDCFAPLATTRYTQFAGMLLVRRKRFDSTQIWKRFVVRADRQNADVRGSSFQMRLDAVPDLLLTAPGHDVINQAVATAIRKIGVRIAQGLQVVRIVRQPGN